MKWLLNLRLFTQGKISVWTLKQLFSLANFKSDWRGTIGASRTSFPVFFYGSSSAKGRMFKKSLSYNVAPWLIGVERKNQNIRSSFEENQADSPLCYVLFCFSLFSPSFYLLNPMEDKMTFRQSWSMLLRCTPATVPDRSQTRKFWWRKYSVGFKIPFEKTFITISYILLFFGHRSLIRNNTQIIFLFRYLGIKATESGVLLVTRKFIHPVHLSA